MKEHVMPPEAIHTHWDTRLPPALVIESGDIVSYVLPDVTGGVIHPGSQAEDLLGLTDDYALLGPLHISGAMPGDALEIEVLDLNPGSWGWTGAIPGYGLLHDEFLDPILYHWDLSRGREVQFLDLATIPLAPFCGTMGVSPATDIPRVVIPPGQFGGNLDCRDLTVGAHLWLPIQVPGAYFSVGDPHGVQGHGEVCGTAIECPMGAVFRFHLHKGSRLKGPIVKTSGSAAVCHQSAHSRRFMTLGSSETLMSAARDALRQMLEWMERTYAVTHVEAYILSSLIVDLTIIQVVNTPQWTVAASLPLEHLIEPHDIVPL
jgi:acetamidase/formamidase